MFFQTKEKSMTIAAREIADLCESVEILELSKLTEQIDNQLRMSYRDNPIKVFVPLYEFSVYHIRRIIPKYNEAGWAVKTTFVGENTARLRFTRNNTL